MIESLRCVVWSGFLAFGLVANGSAVTLRAQKPAEPAPAPAPAPEPVGHCAIDLALPGMMRDVLSNAMVLGLRKPAAEVRKVLDAEVERASHGEQMLQPVARHFAIDVAVLKAEVERYRHCNCSHPPVAGQQALPAAIPDVAPSTAASAVVVSPFAKDVLLHVVLHELGHALVREFDLPVLGNEETLADAFATHFLLHHLPERAPEVLAARVRSWLLEASEVPRADWPVHGEHDNDARRAFRTAALAVAVDPKTYAKLAGLVGMTDRDVRRASDYGSEVHRSWRRVLQPLLMPAGQPSKEAYVDCPAKDPLLSQLHELGLVGELERAVRRFDWHSQVTIRFAPGDGGAAWSRNGRTVLVHAGYLERFVAQGQRVDQGAAVPGVR
jgi:hypothetical protein